MPTDAGAPRDQTWYAITYGPVRFVVLSTEHNFLVDSEQYEWVEQQFAAVNRAETPYLVLTGHRPMYIDSTNESPNGETTRKLV